MKNNMNNIKAYNLERKRQQYKGTNKALYTNHQILLDFFNRNPNEFYFDWEVPHACPLGWVGNMKRRRLQELSSQGLLEVQKVGKYVVYSAK